LAEFEDSQPRRFGRDCRRAGRLHRPVPAPDRARDRADGHLQPDYRAARDHRDRVVGSAAIRRRFRHAGTRRRRGRVYGAHRRFRRRDGSGFPLPQRRAAPRARLLAIHIGGWIVRSPTKDRKAWSMSAEQNSSDTSAFRFSSLPRNVIALGLVSFFNDASSEIIYPLLPLFLTSTLGASMAFVGLIEGIAESTSSLLKLPAGWFSDRLKRRKAIVVAGYGLASLVRPLLALVTAAWQVLGLRLVDRIGKGIRSSPRDAMIADAAPAGSRGLAFGFHRAMDHTGAIVGSLLSAGLVRVFQNNYRHVFRAATVPALVALLILIFAVSERRGPEASEESTQAAAAEKAAMTHPLAMFQLSGFSPDFKKFLAILFLFTLTSSSDAFLLLRAQQSGISAALIPLLWAALHVSKALSSIVGGGLSDRFGRRALIIGGWVLYAAIYFGFAFAGTS